MMKLLQDRVGNILGKGENATHQHFLLFPQCFRKPSSSGSSLYGTELTLNPLPDDKILVWSKLKQVADDILKCV